MKKVFAILMTVMLCLSIVACDNFTQLPQDEETTTVQDEKIESEKETNSSNKTTVSSKPSHTHSFSAATCTKPKTCSCGATEGTALGHSYNSGVCGVCGANDPNYVKKFTYNDVKEYLIGIVKKQGTYDNEEATYMGSIADDEYGYTALRYKESEDSLSLMRVTDLDIVVCTTKFALGNSNKLDVSYVEESTLESLFAYGYTDKSTFKKGIPITFSSGSIISGNNIGKITNGTEASDDMRREVCRSLDDLREFLAGTPYTLALFGFSVYQ